MGGGRLNILVVDDDRGTRNALELWLARLGFNSILCHDAEDAFDKLREALGRGEPVEMILTDQVLPGQSGLEFIMSCRGLSPGLKAVLISGYQDENLQRRARELPHCLFLAKPFTSEDLLRAFRELERADAS